MGRKYDEIAKAKKKAYYEANKEHILAMRKARRESNEGKEWIKEYKKRPYYKDLIKKYNESRKEYKKSYTEKNKERISEREKARYYANYEKERKKKNEYAKWYAKSYKNKLNARTAKRRAARIQRTPKWADLKAISKFYENCPPGMVVDHIIPLRGRNVSGLHVLENLQYLTKEENLRKNNKF